MYFVASPGAAGGGGAAARPLPQAMEWVGPHGTPEVPHKRHNLVASQYSVFKGIAAK